LTHVVGTVHNVERKDAADKEPAMTAATTTTCKVRVTLQPLYGPEYPDARILINGADGGAVVEEFYSWKTGHPVAYYEVKALDCITTGIGREGRCYNGGRKYYRAATRDEAIARFVNDRAYHELMVWHRPGVGETYADGTPVRYSSEDAEGCIWRLPMR
jgi:hypothetical protein